MIEFPQRKEHLYKIHKPRMFNKNECFLGIIAKKYAKILIKYWFCGINIINIF
jgi:hypothetical protein